ncbi:hypothetical protein GCM10023259_040030 [Thermocatellispora tengchongensis]
MRSRDGPDTRPRPMAHRDDRRVPPLAPRRAPGAPESVAAGARPGHARFILAELTDDGRRPLDDADPVYRAVPRRFAFEHGVRTDVSAGEVRPAANGKSAGVSGPVES